MFSLPILAKTKTIIYYYKFKTSNLILYNYTSTSTDLLETSYICSNVPWETVSPKKIITATTLSRQLQSLTS